jgi:CDP-diacylglycerol--glycerol-3-phosphate 3-phosphatidyltransferase
VLSFWIGILTRVEVIAILLVLKEWTNDVPTLYHAVRLRQNKLIRRNKFFNG